MTLGNFRRTPAILNLIIINVLVFFAQKAFDGGNTPLTDRLALYPLKSGLFRPYQIITHMFAHGGFGHILFNMFTLWSLGSILEQRWGSKKFLVFYFICGLAAAASIMFFSPAPAIGASGAIMGLLAAFGYLYPNLELFMFPVPFPIKAKWAILILAAINIFGGFGVMGGNIAYAAHVGGLVMGFLLVYFRKSVYY